MTDVLDLAGGGAARRNLERQRASRRAAAARVVGRGHAAHKVRPATPSADGDLTAVVELLSRRLDRPTTADLLARLLGVDVQAARVVLGIADHGGTAKRAGGTTTSRPRSRTEQGREQGREELYYRAGWLTAAARRLNGLTGDELTAALARERNYWQAHVRARRGRMEAAAVDAARAESDGPRLGWYAHVEDRLTTPECRAAHGHDYDAVRGPRIGRPGTLHGGTCRCVSGPPWGSRRSVDDVTRRFVAV